MKTQDKATPRPWVIETLAGKQIISQIINANRPEFETVAEIGRIDIQNDNAELIVRAVNSHDELLEALKTLMQMIKDGKLVRDISKDSNFLSFFEQSKELVTNLTNASLAIAKAEGELPNSTFISSRAR